MKFFFNNIHTAIAILDKEFNFIRVNELYAKACNRLVSDFPGHNHFEFYPSDEVESIFRNVVETGKIYQSFSHPFVYPENPERDVSYWDWTLVPATNSKGDVEILIFILVNITEHKRKELELEQFFELSHDLLCVVDYDFVIKRINKSIENTLGYSKNEIVDTRVIDYIHPEDTYTVLSAFSKLFKSNLPMINFTNRVRCKGGTYKWIEWSNVPNSKERVFYAVGRDITEKKEMEEIIIKSDNSSENDYRWININAVPQFRAGEKKRALEALNNARKRAEITHRMASLGNMTAGIAHEINQPLNAIKIIVDSVLYLHEAGRNLSLEVILQKLEEVSKQVDRIDGAIRHMKTLVRNERLDLTTCDLNSAVEEALNMMNAQLSSHGILVNRKLKDELPMVTAEQCGLEKVILNLVINAMQALDEAGKENKEITITTFVDRNVILEISDNAQGIDEEIIDKIFDPFFTTKEAGEGMGLGLSIVLTTVTIFQGKISVRNNERGGATFRVKFQSKNSYLN